MVSTRPSFPMWLPALVLSLALTAPVSADRSTATAQNCYGVLPLSFVQNLGQTDSEVRFTARTAGYSLFLTSAGAVMSLDPAGDAPAVVRMKLIGAKAHPQITGVDPLPGVSNYFVGKPESWRRNVPTYSRVKYTAVYPGVDLIYYGNQRRLEYDFAVAPGADPGRIALSYEGAECLSLDDDGNLLLSTAAGSLVQRKPVAYQEVGDARVSVEAEYRLLTGNRIGFRIAEYDTTRALVIDPVLVYATYAGGSSNDLARAIAVDGAGNAYFTGDTSSANFPGATASPIQNTYRGNYDVFVAKLNAAGTALVYSTFLGGSGGDFGHAIAVDADGNAYITGETSSPTNLPGGTPFPVVGGVQNIYRGGGDAFFTKLNPTGTALVYSTYFGGSGVERGHGVAVDSAGAAYFTGHTNSTNLPLASPIQLLNGGNYDAWVVKLSPAGSSLEYSTYLGGTGSEYSIDGGDIAVDASGGVYVGGATASGFPGASSSPIQPVNGGGFNDGWVAKLNLAGGTITWSTHMGGDGYDSVYGLALDAANNVYVTGYTDSTDFPTVSPIQATLNGFADDAFVAKLNAAGTALVYSPTSGERTPISASTSR